MPDSSITKKALANAMKQLMAKKPFSKINVGDICALCNMNRKSFYYHFKDKYDLVNWIYYTEFVSKIKEYPLEDGWKLFDVICEYFYDNRDFYVNALEVSGQNSFHDYFIDTLGPIMRDYLSEILSGSENAPFFAVFFADAFLHAIERWLAETPCRPASEFVKLLSTSIEGLAVRIAEDIKHTGPDKV